MEEQVNKASAAQAAQQASGTWANTLESMLDVTEEELARQQELREAAEHKVSHQAQQLNAVQAVLEVAHHSLVVRREQLMLEVLPSLCGFQVPEQHTLG